MFLMETVKKARTETFTLIGLGDMVRLKNVLIKYWFLKELFFSLKWYTEFQLIDQNNLSSSLIAGFVDHQYLWKESINGFDFLHSDIHIHMQSLKPYQSLLKYALCVIGWFGRCDQIENSSGWKINWLWTKQKCFSSIWYT